MFFPRPALERLSLFILLWVLLFTLFLPATNAGFVSDTTTWLARLQHSSFWDHINRTDFKAKKLYQFSQLITWCLYKLWGTNAWCWHFVHISLHAANATLLYCFGLDLLNSNKMRHANAVMITSCLLFCVLPSISEVIVWEASFHYLLGLLMALSVLRLLQLYIRTMAGHYAVYLLILYFLSSYSIELYYLVPFISFCLLLSHRSAYPAGTKNAWLVIWIPMVIILCLHFLAVKLVYGHWFPQSAYDGIAKGDCRLLCAKPLQYVAQILLLARFYPDELRKQVYALCTYFPVLVAAYGFLSLAVLVCLVRFRKNGSKALLALIFCSAITLLLVLPLYLPEDMIVVYDRYLYFFSAFFITLFTCCLFSVAGKNVAIALLFIFGIINASLLYQCNKKWGETEKLVNTLMETLPAQSDKTILVLNMPQSMNGIYMICGGSGNEVKTMHDAVLDPDIPYNIIDVCANNIISARDGAHVRVIDDSTFRVTLNQYGTWWWYNDFGASGYENEHYAISIHDLEYELKLKKNPARYQLLFQNEGHWVAVDPRKKNADQY